MTARSLNTFSSLLLVQLSLLMVCVSCTTFYVSPNGNDSNSGTSTSSPFKTIQKGVSTAGNNPLVLMSGEYSGNGNSGISVFWNLTISAEPGVSVSCAGTINQQVFYVNWNSIRNSYSGFTIHGCKYGIFNYQSSSLPRYTTIQNMHFDSVENGIFLQNTIIDASDSKFTNLKTGVASFGFWNGVNMENCVFDNITNNAIFLESCLDVSNITNTLFIGGRNSAIETNSCRLSISHSMFAFNSAFSSGSSILANESSAIFVENSTFVSNEAYSGGAISIQKGASLTVNNSVFTNNTGHYGGVFNNNGNLNVFNSVFYSNNATFGGAYYCVEGEILLDNVLFSNNVGVFGDTSYCTECLVFGSNVKIIEDSGYSSSCTIHEIPTSDLLSHSS